MYAVQSCELSSYRKGRGADGYFAFSQSQLAHSVLLFTAQVFYFSLHLLSHEFTGNGFQQLRLLSTGSDEVGGLSGRNSPAVSGTQVPFSWLPFSDHFPSHVSGSYLGLSNVLNMHIYFLGKNLALNLFVYNNSSSMLGNIVDFQFCHVNIDGHSFLNSSYSLGVCNATFLVNAHVYVAKETTSCFPKDLENMYQCLCSFPLCLSSWQVIGRWQFPPKGLKFYIIHLKGDREISHCLVHFSNAYDICG